MPANDVAPSARVVVAVGTADQEREVIAALPASASATIVASCDALVAEVLSGNPALVVLDFHDRAGTDTRHAVRELRSHYPSCGVALYIDLTPQVARDLLTFARLGVNDIILRGVDSLAGALEGALPLRPPT